MIEKINKLEKRKNKMTVKDLIIREGCTCLSYPIDKNHHLFIEGLNDNGELINNMYNTWLVKNVLIELIYNVNYEVIDTIEATLSTKILDIVKDAKKLINLKGGRKWIKDHMMNI